jgi:hypothetical protein
MGCGRHDELRRLLPLAGARAAIVPMHGGQRVAIEVISTHRDVRSTDDEAHMINYFAPDPEPFTSL